TVEAFLTSPLESTIQQLRGVEKIVSESTEGSTEITVEFNRDTDMDFARLDLSERIARLEEELPQGVRPITVRPYVPRAFEDRAGSSVLTYTITGPYVLEALRAHVDDVIKPALEQLDGVGEVTVYGGRDRLLRIELDENQILALGLTPVEVRQSIQGLDLVREAGAIREGDRELTLTIQNRANSVEDIENAIVSTRGESIIRVADIAHVSDTYEEARQYNRINSSPAVSFDVRKETRANTVEVAEAVKERMARLESLNPFGARIIEVRDQSEYIRRQLTDLRYRALIAAVVVFVVLLLFLRSFRSAAMIFATIAFSVLISLNLIYFGGMTLNLLTLMGLAMGFGLIVDNSIVVLENVYRRWQGGEDSASAAEHGAKEVVLPIMAATATTLIVFVPFVYLQGELRVFYVPLAIVVGLTLIASLFVAFTFIPALSARLLNVAGPRRMAYGVLGAEVVVGEPPGSGQAGASTRPLYVRFYSRLVGITLRYPWVAVTIAVVSLGASYYVFDKNVNRGVIWGGGGGQQETYVSVNID
ncbi:MAG: efflux RND transporter permease subunit, partial [Gemmatimonadetes bacterium]|nr:efflux RND transporter permease subunit [Gemmatimonadota bacterium]